MISILPDHSYIFAGLTTELITPNLTKELGLDKRTNGAKTISGLAAGGGTATNPIIDLEGASLCCGKFSTEGGLALPGLHAVITDFPQEHVDPAHDVSGMLGMKLCVVYIDISIEQQKLTLLLLLLFLLILIYNC